MNGSNRLAVLAEEIRQADAAARRSAKALAEAALEAGHKLDQKARARKNARLAAYHRLNYAPNRRIPFRSIHELPVCCVQSWRPRRNAWNSGTVTGVLHAANGGSNAGDHIACNTNRTTRGGLLNALTPVIYPWRDHCVQYATVRFRAFGPSTPSCSKPRNSSGMGTGCPGCGIIANSPNAPRSDTCVSRTAA